MVKTKQQQQEFVRRQQNANGFAANQSAPTVSSSTLQQNATGFATNQSVPTMGSSTLSVAAHITQGVISVDQSQTPSSSYVALQKPEILPVLQQSATQSMVLPDDRTKQRRLANGGAAYSTAAGDAVVVCGKRKTISNSPSKSSVSQTPTIIFKKPRSSNQTPNVILKSSEFHTQSPSTSSTPPNTNQNNQQSTQIQVQFVDQIVEGDEPTESIADNDDSGSSSSDESTNEENLSRQAKWNRKNRKEKRLARYWLLGYQREAEFFRLSKLEKKCKFCYAVFFIEELPVKSRKKHENVNTFTGCCHHGRLHPKLAQFIGDYPEELRKYFMPETPEHAMFMEWIRIVNSSFSFASLACNKFDFPTRGQYCFKITGQIYHKINLIAIPEERKDATNGQLYFVDTNEALQLRQDQQKIPDKFMPIMEHFERYIRQNNRFAHSYRLMKDVYSDAELECKRNGTLMPEIKMLFCAQQPEILRKNKWKMPASNEICAIIFTNAQGEVPPARIVVHATGEKQLKNIHPLDPMVEPMLYPLFYPRGRFGWDYKMCDLDDMFSPHHRGGKLFQQWIVNMAAIVEWDRTQYIVHNQKVIAKTTRENIEDYLRQSALTKNAVVLRQVILPASFIGSQRNLHESFMDAMTIVGFTGKPDFFLTFTCNPNDPDIVENLVDAKLGPSNGPDMVMRVFRLKKLQLIDELRSGLFGEMIAHCWVIEFQIRGNPHMHMLFTVEPRFKLYTPEQVDKVIQAQFPDPKEDPELFNLVATHMVHGPCHYGSPCWEGDKETGKCSKGFPKKFQETTQLNENGYPLYQRPNNGRFIRRKGEVLHNGYVIPYSPYLLKRFRAHINLEMVNSILAVKYLYKYIYKGFDQTCVECYATGPNGEKLGLKYDEVGAYLQARTLSPAEACARLFKFQMQAKSHNVEKLDVHLENEQQFFLETDATQEVIQATVGKDSKLTAYFKFLQKHPDFSCLYLNMPQHCKWDKTNRCWRYRKKGGGKCFGRLHYVNPKHTERFYFRELLVRFCERSYKDYLTYQGITYSSYAEVALARKICRDDDEFVKCLQEASLFRFPRGLRTLFATILVHCAPKIPGLLWDKFKDELSEDIAHKYKDRLPMGRIYAMALHLINEQLKHNNKSLADFATMPQKTQQCVENAEEDANYDRKIEKQMAKVLIDKMNPDQLEIMDFLNQAFVGNETKQLFIDGPGGTGKSFVLLALYRLGRAHGKRICNMAFSGIAATILEMGQTLHKRFNLPLDVGPHSSANIPNQGKEYEELKKVDIFIWDEAPTASKWIFEIIDKKLREIMGCNKPFGGKTMILAGDFRQCLTIKEHATRSEIIDLLIKNSWLWPYFTCIPLTKNMRANESEIEFAANLLDIGNGIAGTGDFFNIPKECILEEQSTTSTLADEIFGEFFKGNFKDYNNAILSPYNSVVDMYNSEIIDRMPGEELEYLSIDETDPNKAFHLPSEELNKQNPPSLPPHKLKLKKNCILMLVRNLNIREGLCNGTRLKLLEAKNYVLRCEILTGHKAGQEAMIPRITLIDDGKKNPFQMHRHQFPLKYAFAFTINKSQSQTFDKIGIDYTSPPFSHGQTYVALSRARSWGAIRVRLDEEDRAKQQMRNIVWREALLSAN